MSRARIAVSALILAALPSMWAPAGLEPRAQAGARAAEQGTPWYIVLATDVSGSMTVNDPATKIPETNKDTFLRDDAQFVFLYALPRHRPNNYIGVLRFTDRVEDFEPPVPQRADDPILLPWRKTNINVDDMKTMVRSPKSAPGSRTDVAVAMNWAHDRIRRARQQHGPGPGKLILLTDGDPTNARRQLAGQGTVLRTAAKLKSEGIAVHPIIINKASYLPTRDPQPLRPEDKLAEQLMERLAEKTDGRSYRITRELTLHGIFLDILDAGGQPADTFSVSDRVETVIIIGEPIRDILINGKASPPEIPVLKHRLATLDILVVTRPRDLGVRRKVWDGTRWKVLPKKGRAAYEGWVYLIPDFFVEVEPTPPGPWWIHEQVRVRARLLARLDPVRQPRAGARPLDGTGLNVRMVATPRAGGKSVLLAGDLWDAYGAYASKPFSLTQAGEWRVSCDLSDTVQSARVPLGRGWKDIRVDACPVTLRLTKAGEKDPIVEVPARGATARCACKGDDMVQAELELSAALPLGPVKATLHLTNVPDPKHTLSAAGGRRLATRPFRLPKTERRLAGYAEVEVATRAGRRTLRLPSFDFKIDVPALRQDREFADLRDALWAREFHKQTVAVTVEPVFPESLASVKAQFPNELPHVRVTAENSQTGAARAVRARCRLTGQPRALGEPGKGRPVRATYTLECDTPLPAADRCVIELGTVAAGLQAKRASYPVVDTMATGDFSWRVCHPPGDKVAPGVSPMLYRGEPVRFEAAWSAQQNVTKVSFVVQRPAGAKSLAVELPVAAGAARAHVDRTLAELEARKTSPVLVVVEARPPEADAPMTIRLDGGSFRLEDPWPALVKLRVGTIEDLPCHALEETELPVLASFARYNPDFPPHSVMMEAFKQSCKLDVALRPPTGEELTEDVSGSLRWTAARKVEPGQGQRAVYQFDGRALFAPRRRGLAAATLTAGVQSRDGGLVLRTAKGRLAVNPARLVFRVTEEAHDGENLLFDSQRLVDGEESCFPVTTSKKTRLRVDVQAARGAAGAGSWTVGVEVRRYEQPGQQYRVELAQRKQVRADGPAASVTMDVSTKGDYRVRFVTEPRGAGDPRINLLTPTLLSFGEFIPVPIDLPPGRLTELVRQWPFKYRIALPEDWRVPGHGLIFEFRMPGEDAWFGGLTYEGAGPDGARSLFLETPAFLPRLGAVESGPVLCRLMHHDAELAAWQHADVVVADPGLAFQLKEKTAEGTRPISAQTDYPIELVAPTAVVASARVSLHPSLQRRWTSPEVKVYVLQDPDDDFRKTVVSEDALERLVEAERQGSWANLQVFTAAAQEPDPIIGVHQPAPASFWGCSRPAPGRVVYAVIASATYTAGELSEAADATPRRITEWSDLRVVDVTIPVPPPFFRWALLALVALAAWVVGVQVLKRFTPSPEGLGLTAVVTEGIAEVEPCVAGNDQYVAIKETGLKQEAAWCGQDLAGRLKGAQPSDEVGTLARLCAGAQVLFRRGFWPRRRAWFWIHPKPGEAATNVEHALPCICTSFWKKDGWLASRQTGRQELPKAPKSPEPGSEESWETGLAADWRGDLASAWEGDSEGASSSVRFDLQCTFSSDQKPTSMPVTLTLTRSVASDDSKSGEEQKGDTQ